MFVWDAPGHADSYPFQLTFTLADKARMLDDILKAEGFDLPVIVGQSMGGYLGQMYADIFPGKLKGLVIIDSAPLKREYYTGIELWLLERMEPVYRHYPWKMLLKQGTNGVASSEYGRKLMLSMMMTYDGDQKRYAALAGHGYRILAGAVKSGRAFDIKCPVMLICGTKDHAGSCIRYNKTWEKRTGIHVQWIEGAGHNSNTDEPEKINDLIESFLENEVK
jgi:pimeloyl-ACP methyl ester carboxylesterase